MPWRAEGVHIPAPASARLSAFTLNTSHMLDCVLGSLGDSVHTAFGEQMI